MAFNWNPATTNANIDLVGNSVTHPGGSGTTSYTDPIPLGEKVYWEIEVSTFPQSAGDVAIGINRSASDPTNDSYPVFAPGFTWEYRAGLFVIDGAFDTNAPTAVQGDVLQIAYDQATGQIWPGVNNTFVGDPAAGTGGVQIDPATLPDPEIASYAVADPTHTGRWLESDFTYPIPAGFIAVDAPSETTGQINFPVEFEIFNPIGQPQVSFLLEVGDQETISQSFELDVVQTGEIENRFELDVPFAQRIKTLFELGVRHSGEISVLTDFEVGPASDQLTLIAEISVQESSQIVQGFQLDVYDPSVREAAYWSAMVILDDVDVSSRLTGTVGVSATESAARIASFTLRPFSGNIDPNAWVGKRVTIDYVDFNGIGHRLFTGLVDTPTYNPDNRTTEFQCTDGLQNSLEGATRDQITRLVGGYWSPSIFDPEADGWQYAKDRISTIPAAFDLDRFQKPVVHDWATAPDSDFGFTENNVLDGSLGVSLASRREIVNKVDLEIDYRFSRLRQRERRFSWSMSDTRTFCEYLKQSSTLPNRPMITGAIESTGWTIAKIEFQELPPNGEKRCPPPELRLGSTPVRKSTFWNMSDELREYLVWAVYFTVAKRWAQTITQSYDLDVVAPQSIDALGEVATSKRVGFQTESDEDGWEDFEQYESPPANGTRGDFYRDADDSADFDQAMKAVIGQARNTVLESHRANSVTYEAIILPELERYHTCDIVTDTVTAKGKVQGIEHNLDIEAGTALTTITLAVSRKLGSSTAQDTGLSYPDRPALEDESAGRYNTRLPTYLGDTPDAPPEDPEWVGYVGNYDYSPVAREGFDEVPLYNAQGEQTGTERIGYRNEEIRNDQGEVTGYRRVSTFGVQGETISRPSGGYVYSEKFAFDLAAVSDNQRQAAELTASQQVVVAIPNDNLQLAA